MDRELEVIARRTRVAYSVAAAAGLVVVAVGWFALPEPTLFDNVRSAVLAAILVVVLVALRLEVTGLERTMKGGVLVAAVVLVAHLVYNLVVLPLGADLVERVNADAWGFAIVVVAAFALFGPRQGLRFNATVIAVVALATVALALPDALGNRHHFLRLLQPAGLLTVLVALAQAATASRERLQRAQLRADLFEELATTDALTGLANRRAAIDALNREARQADRYGTSVSVILADLDHFKDINDQYGHAVGDLVLKGVGALLGSSVRETDVVARWGGEEFLVVAPQTDTHAALQLAERCRTTIGGARPGGYPITASFGVASYERGETIDRLLSRVDRRLYAAKQQGRDRAVDADGDRIGT